MKWKYKVTSWNDEDLTDKWEKEFDDALSAVRCFESFVDHGFANEYRTVNLFEPTGKCHTRVFSRYGTVVQK